jgi:hypothetical protein
MLELRLLSVIHGLQREDTDAIGWRGQISTS